MKTINKNILDKLMHSEYCREHGYYDTKTYRYTYTDKPDRRVFKRIELSALGTTAAIDGWEELAVHNADE